MRNYELGSTGLVITTIKIIYMFSGGARGCWGAPGPYSHRTHGAPQHFSNMSEEEEEERRRKKKKKEGGRKKKGKWAPLNLNPNSATVYVII